MATTPVAIPISGLIPGHPGLAPAPSMALTPQQRRELQALLRQAPNPQAVLRALRSGLRERRPLPLLLADLRAKPALPVLRSWALTPPPPSNSAALPAGRATPAARVGAPGVRP